MNTLDLLSYRKMIIENKIIFSFEGKMSQKTLIALVEALKEKLMGQNDSSDKMHYLVRKIYAIYVELAQNIQNHSYEKVLFDEQEVGTGIIVIREDEKCYTIASGNSMLKSDAEKLNGYSNILNNLGVGDLKKMYKEKLRITRKEGVRGAGIGLIDIIRKSRNPLKLEMYETGEKTMFVTLSAELAKSELDGNY